jgi:hypothetical protein
MRARSAAGNSGLGVLVDDINSRGGNVVLVLEILTMDPNTKTVEPARARNAE